MRVILTRLAIATLALTALSAAAAAQSGDRLQRGDFAIQLASFKSPEAAENGWSRLKKAHPKLLSDMSLNVQTADLGDRGIFYRIQTGPFPTQATAEDMCWQLRAENVNCLVVRR